VETDHILTSGVFCQGLIKGRPQTTTPPRRNRRLLAGAFLPWSTNRSKVYYTISFRERSGVIWEDGANNFATANRLGL